MMRTGAKEGYNIAHGSGDNIERATTRLSEQIRSLGDDYEITFIGGLTLKEDSRNNFNAVREVMLAVKKMADMPPPRTKDCRQEKR